MYMFVSLFLMTIVQFQLSSSWMNYLDFFLYLSLQLFLIWFSPSYIYTVIRIYNYFDCGDHTGYLMWSRRQNVLLVSTSLAFVFFFLHLEFILYHSWSVCILQTYGLLYDSALTWFIRYIHYTNLQLLNNIIIIKTKVSLPHAWVTLADFAYHV